MAVGTVNMAASYNQQPVLFVEQCEDPLGDLPGVDTAAQRPQLGLDFGQAFSVVGPH